MDRPTIRPIRTESDHEAGLARIEALMDAEAGTDQADELDVWATLVELYERDRFPMELPDPVSALRFRMEQAGLAARDLIPFIGSRAKVSEVLSGKRPLTLQMIRALHGHLRIPAEVLLRRPGGALPEAPEGIEWSQFPVAEMAKRGWIRSGHPEHRDLKDSAEEIMCDLIQRAGGFDALPDTLFRKNDSNRRNAKTDSYALQAWCFQVLATARATKLPRKYREGTITEDWARNLAKLSRLADGPRLAKEHLEKSGVSLLFVEHLPRTHLDGAAMLLPDGSPVVAVTLRYDRLDNFWFCLFHEVAHVALHLQKGSGIFIDDLTLPDAARVKEDPRESEADRWAAEMLIPNAEWQASVVGRCPNQATVLDVANLAQALYISPAIVAGRIRKETRNYRLLSHFVGNGEVRKHLAKSVAPC